MPPPSPLYTYCDETDVQAVLSVDGEVGRLDDYNIGLISPVEQAYLGKYIGWATGRINLYCSTRYAQSDLAQSLNVNYWASVLVCSLLSKRRGNPSPSSIGEMYEETMTELKAVASGELQIPEIGLRDAAWPAWSNVRVDCMALLRKVRVERVQGMSDMAPSALPRNDDFGAMIIPSPF